MGIQLPTLNCGRTFEVGFSSSKTKSTSKPVYSGQVEGAASNINNAYNAQSGKISGITGQLGGLVPGLIDQYKTGDTGVNAAQSYNTDVLSGKYLDAGNPYLQSQIDQTNAGVRNGLAASLGTRGLTGGSAFGDIITKNLAANENNLRYTDYTNERNRMGQAVGASTGLAAADYLPLTAIQDILQAQQAPIQAATGAGAGVGGLLGQYTNTTQKSSPGLGAIIAQLAGNTAQAYAMGG
jgi:hypothetical protein